MKSAQMLLLQLQVCKGAKMSNKKILAFFVLGIVVVFLAACSQPKKEAAPQTAPEVQKEIPQEPVPAEVPKEAAMPSQINEVGNQIDNVDQTSSEINAADMADVDSALADVETI